MKGCRIVKLATWMDLLSSLWDEGKGPRKGTKENHPLPGVDLDEWMSYIRTDFDEIDREMIDSEGIGG